MYPCSMCLIWNGLWNALGGCFCVLVGCDFAWLPLLARGCFFRCLLAVVFCFDCFSYGLMDDGANATFECGVIFGISVLFDCVIVCWLILFDECICIHITDV